MRHYYLAASIALIPFYAQSQTINLEEMMFFPLVTEEKNTLVKTYTNETDKSNEIPTFNRTSDYPTQIIRMNSSIEGQKVTCEEVNNELEQKIISTITSDKFAYHTIIHCTFDPDNGYAKEFKINSYFDPINDEGVIFLKSWLAVNNDSEILGVKLKVESAKGLIVTLNIAAGIKKNPQNPPFVLYKQDRSSYYFKNNYEMQQLVFSDIYENFFSNEPNKILPFLNKWLFTGAGSLYKNILIDSNFVEIQPEQIFLMETGEHIFISKLKYYFGHSCLAYENHRCLKPSS